jgi:hypothetical protein
MSQPTTLQRTPIIIIIIIIIQIIPLGKDDFIPNLFNVFSYISLLCDARYGAETVRKVSNE